MGLSKFKTGGPGGSHGIWGLHGNHGDYVRWSQGMPTWLQESGSQE